MKSTRDVKSKHCLKSKQCLIRVDASPEIGAGHLMRCMALAAGLRGVGLKPVFVVNETTAALIRTREDFDFQVQVLPALATQDSELKWLAQFVRVFVPQYVVLDGYQFKAEYREKIRTLTTFLVVFDDENNSGCLHGDVIINAAENAHRLDYKTTAPGALLLLGRTYTVLRAEFSAAPLTPYDARRSCLITFGASDVKQLSLPVVSALARYNASESASGGKTMPLKLVTGSAVQNVTELQRNLQGISSNLTHYHNLTKMRPLYEDAKVAVSAAGSSTYELLAMGVPCVLVVVADNQMDAALAQTEYDWCRVIDARQSEVVDTIATLTTELWADINLRHAMHRNALEHCVRNGVETIASALLQMGPQ